MAASTSTSAQRPDVVIVGAGVIGLSIAWRLAQRGAAVTVLERGQAGGGASHAAAGMLAACAEAEPGEEALVALGRASQALWPAFAAELEATAGLSVDLRRDGTLVLALNVDDQATPASSARVPEAAGAAARLDHAGGGTPARAAPRRQSRARCSAPRTTRSTTANWRLR